MGMILVPITIMFFLLGLLFGTVFLHFSKNEDSSYSKDDAMLIKAIFLIALFFLGGDIVPYLFKMIFDTAFNDGKNMLFAVIKVFGVGFAMAMLYQLLFFIAINILQVFKQR